MHKERAGVYVNVPRMHGRMSDVERKLDVFAGLIHSDDSRARLNAMSGSCHLQTNHNDFVFLK